MRKRIRSAFRAEGKGGSGTWKPGALLCGGALLGILLVVSGCPNAGLLADDIEKLVDEANRGAADRVATPELDPLGGTYPGDRLVSISCATPGAVIHFTTDGSRPDESDPAYSAPISVAGDGTTMQISAIAVKDAMDDSDVASATYSIDYSLTSYSLSLEAGPNGSITQPSISPVTVSHGVAESISASADADYEFDSWTVVSGSGVSFGAPGSASTEVTLTDGDATIRAGFVETQHPVIGVYFGGSGVNPGDTVNIGSSYLNAPFEVEFTISNDYPSGTEQVLELDGSSLVQLQGSSPDIDMYTVSQQPSQFLLNPQASTTFRITFTPTAIDTTLDADIIIRNNDPDHDPFTFTVRGEGTGTKQISGDTDWAGARVSLVTGGSDYFIATDRGTSLYYATATTFSSADAGVSWTSAEVRDGSTDFDTPLDIDLRANPAAADSLYLALRGDSATNFSLYFASSTDRGANWDFGFAGFTPVPLTAGMGLSVDGTGANS